MFFAQPTNNFFCNHPTVKPLLQSYHFGDDYQPTQNYLLLDCVSRQLYVGKSELVDSYLKEPQALALLTILDSPDPSLGASQQPYLHWLKSRSVIIGSVLLLLLGLPLFGFGTAVMMDEADWLEEISESIWQDD
ncbi:MAG: hypothetical protein HC940_09300 [Acaryochloris sp. SU_5_25]|nr:hypothetical protein [Acaryochloris sp. SU_5_25]